MISSNSRQHPILLHILAPHKELASQWEGQPGCSDFDVESKKVEVRCGGVWNNVGTDGDQWWLVIVACMTSSH